MRLRRLFLSLFTVTMAAMVVDIALVWSMRDGQRRIDQAMQHQQATQALMEEISEGTALLDALLRRHAGTGHTPDLDHYRDILAAWRGEPVPRAADGWRPHGREGMAAGALQRDAPGDASQGRSLQQRLAALTLAPEETSLATTVLEESARLHAQVKQALDADRLQPEVTPPGEPSAKAGKGPAALNALLASPAHQSAQARLIESIDRLSAEVSGRVQAEVDAARNGLERQLVVSLAANALLLSLAAVVFIALRRHLMKPIQALVTEAEVVAGRDPNPRPEASIKEHQVAELELLASTLTRMSETIRQFEAERDGNQREVAQVRDRADAAARAMSTFLAHMSHEIRTPMNAMMGMTILALRTDLSEVARSFLDKSMEASQHLLQVIDDILDYSKIEAGGMSVEVQPFCLEDTVSRAISLVRSRAQAKGLELTCDFESASLVGGATRFYGDALRLQQVLTNLLSNAVKFTDSGQVSVAVAAEPAQDEAPGPFIVTISVRDTGIGMTAEQCTRLFQEFSQADASIARRYGGSGLGLAISQGLMQLMGGCLGVSSEPGGGSCFTLRLWLHPAPDSGRQDPVAGVRLLFVGRNNASYGSLMRLFERMGLRSGVDHTWTPDPDAALDLLWQSQAGDTPYTLVVSDDQLPEASMGRFVSQLRSAWPTLRVGVMAREESAGLRELMNLWGQTVIDTPVMPKQLRRLLGAPTEQRGNNAFAAPSPATSRRMAGMRVLLVEDDPLNQEVALGLLTPLGVKLSIANNGLVAIEMLMAGRRDAFDLVLMDMQMPVLDGQDTVQRLRADRQWDHLPIIAMTGQAMAGDRDRCLAMGMQDYLPKPLVPVQLYETVVRWCFRTAISAADPAAGSGDAAKLRPISPLPEVAGLDMHRLMYQCAGDETLAWRLLQSFVREYAGRRLNTVDGLDLRDMKALRRHAHTLQSIGGTLACDALRTTWLAVEQAAAVSDVAAVQSLLPAAQQVLSALVDSVNDACELHPELGAADRPFA